MTSLWASWRAALRIARREARAAGGRSALVAVMLAIPVLALAFAAAANAMFTLTGSEQADQRMGTADARVTWSSHLPTLQMPDPDETSIATAMLGYQKEAPNLDPGTTEELRAALPGSTVLPLRRGTVLVQTPDGVARPDAVMVDATSPLTRGFVDLLAGRVPEGPGEVALTEQAMAWLHAGIGDTVTVADHPSTVVGRVEFPSLLDKVVLFAYDPDDTAVEQWFSLRDNSWLVETPAPVTWDEVLRLNEQGMTVASRDVFEHPPADEDVPLIQLGQQVVGYVDPDTLALGVIVAGLALLEVVLLAGPAFAVSARRRQRQLALVAANGGTPAHVRRIVLADGVVLGLAGAALGIVLGIPAAFLARPWLEESFAHARAGGYRVDPRAQVAVAAIAVLTGVLAALLPAFITARQSVVASLAGRRGVTRSRKRWVGVGVAVTGLGVVVTMFGTRRTDTTIMLVGMVLGELGLVLCTPALVGLVARIGRLLPLAPRIALRDAARNRAAAAPAISAVMAAVAGSVALGMFLDSRTDFLQRQYHQMVPTGTVQVGVLYDDPEHATPPDAVEAAIRATLPVTEVHRVGQVTCPSGVSPAATCSVQATFNDACPQLVALDRGQYPTIEERRAAVVNPACDPRNTYGVTMTQVDDGAALATLTGAEGEDLHRAQQTLEGGGVVVRSPLQITDGTVTVVVVRPDPDAPPDLVLSQPGTRGPGDAWVPAGHIATQVALPGYLLTTGVGPGPIVIAPGTVASLGLRSDVATLVASTTRLPTDAEVERANATLNPMKASFLIEWGFRDQVNTMLLVLMAAAALITVGAASVGTALAAADSRADLSTLAAVGASPTLRRGLSVSQSGVIAGLGSVLGALAGMGAALAVLAAYAQQYGEALWPLPGPPRPVVPWLTLLVALVATPAVAVAGAGLLTRSRLPIERRL